MKKILRKLLAMIAVTVIVNTATTWVLDRTILSSDFVLEQAKTNNVYPEISKALPQFLRHAEDEQTRLAADSISQVATPDYIENKFSTYLIQLEKHYRTGAAAPVIDFTDLQTIAAQKGLALPQDAVAKPIQPGEPLASGQANWFFKNLKLLEYGGAIASILLLGLIWLAAEAGKKYRAVAGTLLVSAICIVPVYALFQVGPDLADAALKNNPDFLPLEPALKALVGSVFKAAGKQFLISAIVLAGLSVLVFIVHFVFRFANRPKKARTKKNEGGMVNG